MEQSEIISGNRLIAEFMGFYFQTDKFYSRLPGRGNWFKEAKYNRSWKWLMPVVEKISKIPLPGDGTRPAEPHETFFPYTFGMLSPTGRPMVRICANGLFEADTLIEATWLAIVDFIKWYDSKSLPTQPLKQI